MLKNAGENRKEGCESMSLIASLEDSMQEHLQTEHLLHDNDDHWWWVSPNAASNIGMGLGSMSLAQSHMSCTKKLKTLC